MAKRDVRCSGFRPDSDSDCQSSSLGRGWRMRGRVDRHALRHHPASNRRRGPPRLRIHEHRQPTKRNHPAHLSTSRRQGALAPIWWRTARGSNPTPCGANRLPTGARPSRVVPSVLFAFKHTTMTCVECKLLVGAQGGTRTHHPEGPVSKTGAATIYATRA